MRHVVDGNLRHKQTCQTDALIDVLMPLTDDKNN